MEWNDSTAIGVTINGNTITGTGSNGWNKHAQSARTFSPDTGGIEVHFEPANHRMMFGIGKDPYSSSSTSSYIDIEYAFYYTGSNTAVSIYEGGSHKGSKPTPATGEYKIIMDLQGTVKYYRGDALLYTSSSSSVASGESYYIHAAPYTPSSALTASIFNPDDIPPEITAPPDYTADIEDDTTVLDIGVATATDNLDDDVTITHDAPESFPVGNTTVTWRATDDAGNYSEATQTITITDLTFPTLVIPDDITAEATSQFTVLDIGVATATDNFDPNPTVTHDAPESYPVGDTIVTWTATNNSQKQRTATQTITITDTTPPLLSIPPDITIEATSPFTVLDIGVATATDAADSNPTVTNNAPESFPVGNTTVTWRATDNSGNYFTATQNITVLDDVTAPVITLTGPNPQNIRLGDEYFELGATTDDGSQVTIDDSEYQDIIGSYSILYNSVDHSGNNAVTQTRTVRVVDPQIGIPENITINDTKPCFLLENQNILTKLKKCGFGNDFLSYSFTGFEWITGGNFTLAIASVLVLFSYVKYQKASYPLIIGVAMLPISYNFFPVEFLSFAFVMSALVLTVLCWHIFIRQTKEY